VRPFFALHAGLTLSKDNKIWKQSTFPSIAAKCNEVKPFLSLFLYFHSLSFPCFAVRRRGERKGRKKETAAASSLVATVAVAEAASPPAKERAGKEDEEQISGVGGATGDGAGGARKGSSASIRYIEVRTVCTSHVLDIPVYVYILKSQLTLRI